MHGTINLSGIEVTNKKHTLKVKAIVTNAPTLWFEIPNSYKKFIDTQSVDAFLLLYAWYAMEMNTDLVVVEKVSEKLSKSLTTTLIPIFLKINPNLHKINITFIETSNKWFQYSTGRATGFSGGVDSSYTALSAIDSGNPFSLFVFTNTGQHGVDNTNEVFKQRAIVAQSSLGNITAPLLTINSNIDDVFQTKFLYMHTLRNIACALILQNGIDEYAYSSAYKKTKVEINSSTNMDLLDPIILPVMSTERMRILPTGDEKTRNEKINSIVNNKWFSGELYVCTEKLLPVKNCGYCFKCRRTQLALYYLGHKKHLTNNFDSNFFQDKKSFMTLGLLVDAYANKAEQETASAIYSKLKRWQSYPLRWIVPFLSFIKSTLPASIAWRIRNKWPFVW